MHAGAGNPVYRLRHKGCVQAMLLCDGFYRQLECDDLVGSVQCLSILEINLMLCRSHLVMRGLHYKAHILQCHDDISSGILSKIGRTDVKIARLLMCDRRGQTILITLKQEELTLRSYMEGVSLLRRLGNGTFQDITRVAREGISLRIVYITNQSRHSSLLGSPWENGHRV